ncbi:nucleotidyltransferase domain-containing protein [Hippea sp. KM1]|uniref:nucleotidyltransferase domain-containing protein n=1 Tax=Hippea sp. KM1 TaxID=944481 RepID=UPI0018DC9B47|nr:nucleotidyltransferase domain-containing protein [Hippea sp. KM1]
MKESRILDNLKLETLEDLRNFLRDFFGSEKVEIYLFGSRARGNNTSFSDVDIGLLASKDISDKMTVLRDVLEESNFPYKVDLVDLSSNKELLEIVLKEGKRWL